MASSNVPSAGQANTPAAESEGLNSSGSGASLIPASQPGGTAGGPSPFTGSPLSAPDGAADIGDVHQNKGGKDTGGSWGGV